MCPFLQVLSQTGIYLMTLADIDDSCVGGEALFPHSLSSVLAAHTPQTSPYSWFLLQCIVCTFFTALLCLSDYLYYVFFVFNFVQCEEYNSKQSVLIRCFAEKSEQLRKTQLYFHVWTWCRSLGCSTIMLVINTVFLFLPAHKLFCP